MILSLRLPAFVLLALSLSTVSAVAGDYTVEKKALRDPKIVFATVESVDVVAARARIGGTIISLNVKEGDEVKAGQVIAVVGDQKLALQAETLDAQISALITQAEKANADLKRVEGLIGSGAVSRSTLDGAKASASAANNELKARKAQRSLIEQEVTEGKILAPSYGRVLQVPLTVGTVIMPGEQVATIAADSYILRLSIPERHAAFLKKGDKIHLDTGEMTEIKSREGEIALVYPEIENGRVKADAVVNGLNNYFVGERIRVWVNTTERQGFVIPRSYIATQSGVDYVMIRMTDGKAYQVPVQAGQAVVTEDGEGSQSDLVEVLSGLQSGDILVPPAVLQE